MSNIARHARRESQKQVHKLLKGTKLPYGYSMTDWENRGDDYFSEVYKKAFDPPNEYIRMKITITLRDMRAYQEDIPELIAAKTEAAIAACESYIASRRGEA
jgi:hypothetical protein